MLRQKNLAHTTLAQLLAELVLPQLSRLLKVDLKVVQRMGRKDRQKGTLQDKDDGANISWSASITFVIVEE